jgi:RND superfamily putative drug exporter
MVANDGRSTYVEGLLRVASVDAELWAARHVERRLAAIGGVSIGGAAAFYAQGNDVARQDLIRAELLAFPLLLLIALWVFRGLVAAALPLLVGAATIVLALAALRLLSTVMDVSIYALNIATALSLGLAVDYSLLIVSRYREEMAISGPGNAALSRTLATAGRTVLISSLTIAGVLSSLVVFPQAFLRSIGVGGVLSALLAGATALLILPAILTLLRWRVNLLSFAGWRRAAHLRARQSPTSGWYRLSRLVTRRALPVALISGTLLLALASPALKLHITQIDPNVMPRGSGARTVHDAIQSGFPRASNSPVLVAVAAPDSPSAIRPLASYAGRLAALAHVAAVRGPSRLGAGLATIEVVPDSQTLSSASQQLVRQVRALPPPFPVRVGGEDASLVDLRHALASRLPAAVLIVLAVTLLAVFLMTGSIVLPVKALAMSALTIAAVIGALVLVFQNGALQGLLGYTSSHALEPSTLVLIFAMSFGLATDYGIFLLSRIKEMRDSGADDATAVADGLERTGPVITAAVLLLCVALGSLMSARHALVKEVGFGASLAVALDATLVRGALLPALMRLLGRVNWWAPRRLRPSWIRPAQPAATPAAPERVARRRPSETLPAGTQQTLARTAFCDHEHPAIRQALAHVSTLAPSGDPTSVAAAAFEFVRDEILYAFGPWGLPASATLADRRGTCTNKANLLIALLRAAGIPAAYGVMRVNAREYFGVIAPPWLTRRASPESVHVYAAACLNGRWIKCDGSTDADLAARTSHFCKQTRLIEWDGRRDSLDFLDERHVHADLGLFADIDELLDRAPRTRTPQLFAEANDYLEFIRSEPWWESEKALIGAYRSAHRPDRTRSPGPGHARPEERATRLG